MAKKKKFLFIDVIKFIGVLLVLNSHMDAIYPISALATGGAIGNGLFFFASGFLSTNVKLPFGKWYAKRLIRLLPITSIMALIRILILGRFQISTVFIDVIFPTYYWFVAAILLFDIPLYFLVRGGYCVRYKNQILGILAIIYFVYYFLLLDTSKWVVESAGLTSVAGFFKLIYYFGIFLLGAEMHLKIDSLESKESKQYKERFDLLLISATSFVIFYGYKVLMDRSVLLLRLQFIEQLLTAITVVSFAYYMYSIEAKLKKCKYEKIKLIVTKISSLSLELFLTQEIVVIFARQLKFPTSFFIMIAGTFLTAWLLNMAYNIIEPKLIRRIK